MLNMIDFHSTRNGGFRCNGYWAVPFQNTHNKHYWLVSTGWYEDIAEAWVDEECIKVIANTKETAAKRAMRYFKKHYVDCRKRTPQ